MLIEEEVLSAFNDEHPATVADIGRMAVARRTRRHRMIGATAVVMIGSLLTLGVAQQSQTALAGWTAQPQAQARAEQELHDVCRQGWATEGPRGIQSPDARDLEQARRTLKPAVVDARGNAGVAVYYLTSQGRVWEETCSVVWRPGGNFEAVGGGGGFNEAMNPPQGSTLSVEVGFGSRLPELGRRGAIAGLHGFFGVPVERVLVTLADDTTIEARTNEGVWLAWWPSRDYDGLLAWLPDPTRATHVEGLDSEGRVISRLVHDESGWQPTDVPS